MVLIWKVVILNFAHTAQPYLQLNGELLARNLQFGSPYLTWVWANFDGVRYITIAQSGYQNPNFAFFPLLPLLIFLVKKVFSLQVLDAALLITNVSFFIGLCVFYKLVRMDYSNRAALFSIAMVLLFPLSFFFGTVYTESLFFLLSTLTFYFARKGLWVRAGILGYLTSLTRLVGIALLPALLVEWYFRQKNPRSARKLLNTFIHERVYVLALLPLGIVSFGFYLQLTQGDFFLFQKAMANWGQDRFIFPLQTLFRYVRILIIAERNLPYYIALLELASTIAYFILSFFVFLRVRRSYGVFMLTLLLIPTFTGTLQSMPRYVLQLFPAFIALGLFVKHSGLLAVLMAIVFLALQFLFVAMFTRGYFVA